MTKQYHPDHNQHRSLIDIKSAAGVRVKDSEHRARIRLVLEKYYNYQPIPPSKR